MDVFVPDFIVGNTLLPINSHPLWVCWAFTLGPYRLLLCAKKPNFSLTPNVLPIYNGLFNLRRQSLLPPQK